MRMFKDRHERYVALRPEHVSAIHDGGNQHAIVSLRGGQQIAVAGSVEDLWKLLSRQVNLDKGES